MNDFIWFLIVGVMFVGLGLVFIWLGLAIWKKQRTDLIIRHHMDKVADKDKQAYCRLFGIGCLAAGTGFAVSGICIPFTADLISWIPMAAGLAGGILLMAAAVIRYNH